MEWVTVVVSIVSVVIAAFALRTAIQSNQLSEKTHNENKQIDLKLRLVGEIHEVRTLLNRLFLLSVNVSGNLALSKGLIANTIKLLDTLDHISRRRNRPLPEEVASYRQYLTQCTISINAMEQVHPKLMEGYNTHEAEIREIGKNTNPSAEHIAKVVEIKTLIYRAVDSFSEIDNQTKMHITEPNKVQKSITDYISAIST